MQELSVITSNKWCVFIMRQLLIGHVTCIAIHSLFGLSHKPVVRTDVVVDVHKYTFPLLTECLLYFRYALPIYPVRTVLIDTKRPSSYYYYTTNNNIVSDDWPDSLTVVMQTGTVVGSGGKGKLVVRVGAKMSAPSSSSSSSTRSASFEDILFSGLGRSASWERQRCWCLFRYLLIAGHLATRPGFKGHTHMLTEFF